MTLNTLTQFNIWIATANTFLLSHIPLSRAEYEAIYESFFGGGRRGEERWRILVNLLHA